MKARTKLTLASIFIYSAALFGPLPSQAETSMIQEGDLLSLEQCIEIALQAHPDVMGAQKKVEAQESRVGQAMSQNYPELSASTNYSRSSPTGGSTRSNYSSDVSYLKL